MVIGHTGKSFIGASDEGDQRIWYYLAKRCYSVADAIEKVKKEYLGDHGERQYLEKHIDKLGYVGNGGTTIVHAFG